ncbi:TetR/AcrR family transcriptional regulator [Tropicimonas sediminicola]|uniref:Transcriptional regulator, TetR family n=1 Tax=Tropicimonas sediminicola TaxID=1031541 RepID=A0A239J4Y8_9RHOB|nr:TetR/AcrR family transcriptional regulator [Tropicimonas sediminicola]SNT01096.1 transcriptional regulator, TetR family [Tropicimonas sediminicola]
MDERTKPVGRPPNAATSAALKEAALRLMREYGYRKVSIADIASAAGVARQTLYNRWKTKADLVLEAVFEETALVAAEPDAAGEESCRVQLETFLSNVFRHLDRDGDAMRSLIAAAQEDESFQEEFRTRFILPREEMVTGLLRRAQERGEIGRNRDPEFLSTLIHGAMWYRMLNGQVVDAAFAHDIVEEVFRS